MCSERDGCTLLRRQRNRGPGWKGLPNKWPWYLWFLCIRSIQTQPNDSHAVSFQVRRDLYYTEHGDARQRIDNFVLNAFGPPIPIIFLHFCLSSCAQAVLESMESMHKAEILEKEDMPLLWDGFKEWSTKEMEILKESLGFGFKKSVQVHQSALTPAFLLKMTSEIKRLTQ